MWIKTTRRTSDGWPVTRRLKSPDMDAAVEFTDTGTAQVPADVGEYLIDRHDHIVPSDADVDDEGDDGGPEVAEAVDAEPAQTSAETAGEPDTREQPDVDAEDGEESE